MVNIHTGHLKMFLKIKITNGLKIAMSFNGVQLETCLKKLQLMT